MTVRPSGRNEPPQQIISAINMRAYLDVAAAAGNCDPAAAKVGRQAREAMYRVWHPPREAASVHLEGPLLLFAFHAKVALLRLAV
mmetsp:Transcript_31312/g.70351  ORF Transcript_31312/g.70351 Transcript_31312/m.70351 type:complete len:85 (-) Transcript_31312:820-1074(-)